MQTKDIEFIKNDVTYVIHIVYKHQRNIYFRYKDDGFHVSAPYRTKDSLVLKGVEKYFDKLIKTGNKGIHYSFEEDYLYLLGEKVSLSNLGIENEESLNKYLKEYAYKIILEEVDKYSEIMGISTEYKVRIRNTSRQFGSNSKRTHTLSFQTSLIHYSLDIIDTVVVHELAHDFERNHQKGFYDIVYTYSPDYKYFQKKLKKGIHQ